MYHEWWWNSQVPTRSVRAELEGHSAPVDRCLCGLQGYYRLQHAVAEHVSSRDQSVVGAVLGWGRVYLHEQGWRAEWAQPLALTYVGRATQPIQRTAQLLGIPLVRQDAIEDYAAEHGVDLEYLYRRRHSFRRPPGPSETPSTRKLRL